MNKPETPLDTIFDFILNRLTHQVGCPKWSRPERVCECGLDDVRELVKQEKAKQ